MASPFMLAPFPVTSLNHDLPPLGNPKSDSIRSDDALVGSFRAESRSGSLAILVVILLASSLVNTLAADRMCRAAVLALASILASVRDDWKLKKPEREHIRETRTYLKIADRCRSDINAE
jgi:hypothetical protein